MILGLNGCIRFFCGDLLQISNLLSVGFTQFAICQQFQCFGVYCFSRISGFYGARLRDSLGLLNQQVLLFGFELRGFCFVAIGLGDLNRSINLLQLGVVVAVGRIRSALMLLGLLGIEAGELPHRRPGSRLAGLRVPGWGFLPQFLLRLNERQ